MYALTKISSSRGDRTPIELSMVGVIKLNVALVKHLTTPGGEETTTT
jgi:hypothetical protein